MTIYFILKKTIKYYLYKEIIFLRHVGTIFSYANEWATSKKISNISLKRDRDVVYS